jgi:hypothetical protein
MMVLVLVRRVMVAHPRPSTGCTSASLAAIAPYNKA